MPAAALPLAAGHLPAPGWVQPPGGRKVQRGHSVGLLVMGYRTGVLGAEGRGGGWPWCSQESALSWGQGMSCRSALLLGLCNTPTELGKQGHHWGSQVE